jgi:hypothetical protein
VNKDLTGGIKDVDNSMMETMFNLSAYVSGSKNNEDNNVDSDDDASSQLGVRNNCQNAASQGWTHLTGSNRLRCFQLYIFVLRRPCCIKERVDDRLCKDTPSCFVWSFD